MKQRSAVAVGARALLACALLSGGVGCNQDISGQVVTLSGAYLGDLVNVLATGYLSDALGIEASGADAEHTQGDEHAHDTKPLHDYEH